MKPPDVVPDAGKDEPEHCRTPFRDRDSVDPDRPALVPLHQQHFEIQIVDHQPVIVVGRFLAGACVGVVDETGEHLENGRQGAQEGKGRGIVGTGSV